MSLLNKSLVPDDLRPVKLQLSVGFDNVPEISQVFLSVKRLIVNPCNLLMVNINNFSLLLVVVTFGAGTVINSDLPAGRAYLARTSISNNLYSTQISHLSLR